MIIDEEVETFLEHYGVKGQKWGHRRKAKKAAARKAYDRQVKSIVKQVGSRSPSEVYAVRGSHGNIIITGEEFIRRVDMGMKVSSIVSTGQKINDGR